MAAYHNYAAELQRRRDMGSHCQYQRRCAGDWSCAFGAVFCGRYGTHLRQLQRCQETGTRCQALYPICARKGGYHLRYGANAYATGITQNVDDLLQSHTARTMLANSEFIIMLNQASTDRLELAKLLNISDLQMSYITNVEAGHGLIKVGSSLVPFANKFPKNTKLYKLMTTKPGESA